MRTKNSLGIRVFGCLLLAVTPALAAPPNLERGVKAQTRLAARRPDNPSVLNDLANLMLLQGRLEEAEATYLQALDLDPGHVSSRYNLALLQHQTGRRRAAMRSLERVTKEDPDHAWAHYQRGLLLAEKGRRKAALEAYGRALVLEPRLSEATFNPHIVRNNLHTDALLTAYAAVSPSRYAPRVYDNPDRIARLLVPGQARKAKKTAPAQDAEPAAQGNESQTAPPKPQTSKKEGD